MSKQKIVYDDEFTLISTDSLENFNSEFINHTKKCFIDYKKLFGVEKLEKLHFVLFDDLEEYRKDYRQRYHREPPSYSKGNFSNNAAYIFVNSSLIPGTEPFYKTCASGAHEAFHVYYRNLIYKDKRRIVWFDEGMAQFFSKQNDYMNDEGFSKFYLRFRSTYKPITNLNERVQGNSQVPDNKIFTRPGVISGYPLSYLLIRYLVETRGRDYVKEVMRDNERIMELGNTMPSKMISYYDEKIMPREVGTL